MTAHARAAQPAAPRERSATHDAEPEPEPQAGISLEWDIRLIASALWKRYTQRDDAAWSWGAGGGIGLGTAMHLKTLTRHRSRGINWFDFELGVSAAVTFGGWRQVNRGATSMVEQDTALVVGARIALGETRTLAGTQHWSGVMLGIAWLPTYVDFFGSAIASRGTINPAGVRLTVDMGSAAGPDLGRSTLVRLALSWLPDVGRLPTAVSLGVGLAFY